MTTYVLNATLRTAEQQGKGASRRLRRAALVPAIIYGANQEPVAITVEYRELVKLLEDENFFYSPVTIKLEGKEEVAQIKALQRHPAKNNPIHADFLRVAG
ncbi:MAG: 50S ribosomal protein L25 [Acinetobacter sp.]|nr:50S ribosomal protein L25 [Acinetobacter sp.]